MCRTAGNPATVPDARHELDHSSLMTSAFHVNPCDAGPIAR